MFVPDEFLMTTPITEVMSLCMGLQPVALNIKYGFLANYG
jgi:hypothetical protein